MIPSKLMQITLTNVATNAVWPSDSSTYAGYPYRWTVTFTVVPQLHSSASTRAHYVYNGLDVAVGAWISNMVGGHAWKIRSISAQTTSSVTCVVEDVGQYNTYTDSTTTGDGSPANFNSGFLFETDVSGLPILTEVTPNVLTAQWQNDLLSRFLYASPPVLTALLAAVTRPSLDVSPAYLLTLQGGALKWVAVTPYNGATAPTFRFQLEDGSGSITLEDGTGGLQLEG